jgi:tetratricopeptide (TPR) repeat protein
VAGFLERSYADAIDTALDLLAYHYFRGESWPKALDFNLRSAQQAQSEYSNAAAISAAENVLEAAGHIKPDLEIRSDVLSAYQLLGDVLGWEARYPESVEAFRKAIEVAKGWEDLFAESRAWYGMSETQMHKGDLREAITSAEQAEAISTTAGLKLAPIKSLWMQAWGAFRLGEIERAKDLARPLPELSSALGNQGQHAENLNLIGMLSWASGRYDEAQRSFTEAFGIFQGMGDERRAMPLVNNLGLVAESRGDLDSASDQYNEALVIARRIGDRDTEVVSLGNLGRVKVIQGDLIGGEADLRVVVGMTDAAGTDNLSEVHSALAEAMLGEGRLDEALGFAQQALDIAARTESQDDLGRAWRAMGMVVCRLTEPPILAHTPLGPGRACDAQVCFAESARIFRKIGREDELARTLRAWARYEHESGDREHAEGMWNEAKELFGKLGAVREVNRMGKLQ